MYVRTSSERNSSHYQVAKVATLFASSSISWPAVYRTRQTVL